MKTFVSLPVLALMTGLTGCASQNMSLSMLSHGNTDYQDTSSQSAKPMDRQMRMASAAIAGGDSGAAVRILREVTRANPNALEPRLKLGEALLAADAPQEAARAFDGAVRLNGRSVEGRIGLGRAQLAIRQPALALEQFDKALRIEPHNTIALNGKAVALDQIGQHDEAQSIYLTILDEDPSNMRVRSNYGLSLALEGRSAQASDVLASLSAAPDAEPRVRQNLALAYGLAGNDGQAAHVSRLDLDEEAVRNNLQYYQRLRHLEDPIARSSVLNKPAKELVSETFAPVEAGQGAEMANIVGPDQEIVWDPDDSAEPIQDTREVEQHVLTAPQPLTHGREGHGGDVKAEAHEPADIHAEGAELAEASVPAPDYAETKDENHPSTEANSLEDGHPVALRTIQSAAVPMPAVSAKPTVTVHPVALRSVEGSVTPDGPAAEMRTPLPLSAAGPGDESAVKLAGFDAEAAAAKPKVGRVPAVPR